MRKALLRSFKKIKFANSLKAVEEAFRLGGITRVMSLYDSMDEFFDSELKSVFQETFRTSGRLAIGFLPDKSMLGEFTFDILKPGTVDSINTHTARFVQQISDNTREGMIETLRANVIAGNNPRKTARDFRDSIGLTRRQKQSVNNFRRLLEEGDPEALTRQLRDKRFDKTVKDLIDGKRVPQAKIDKMVNRYNERFLKKRSQDVARTESLRAVSMGEQASLQQAWDEGKVNPNLRKFWIFTKDLRTRDEHRDVPSLNNEQKGIPVNEDFQTPLGPLAMPRDPKGRAANVINCRCSVGYRLVQPGEPEYVEVNTPKKKPETKKDAEKEIEQKLKKPTRAEKPEPFNPNQFVKINPHSFGADDFYKNLEKNNVAVSKSTLSERQQFTRIAEAYQDGDDEIINNLLREGRVSNKGEDISKLDAFTNSPKFSHTLNQDTVIYRGLRDPAKVFGDQIIDNPKSLIGTEFVDDGFISTSFSETTSNNFASSLRKGARVEIFAEKGTRGGIPAELTGDFSDEYEFLLPRSTKFEIQDVFEETIEGDKKRLVIRSTIKGKGSPVSLFGKSQDEKVVKQDERTDRFIWNENHIRITKKGKKK